MEHRGPAIVCPFLWAKMDVFAGFLRAVAWAIWNSSLPLGKRSEGPKVHGFIVDERLAKPWQSAFGAPMTLI